jgi:hypothetical protein
MGKSIKAEVDACIAEVEHVEQTIREKVVEALAASGLNVQLKHAENIAERFEAIVEQHVKAALRAAGVNVGGDDEEARS